MVPPVKCVQLILISHVLWFNAQSIPQKDELASKDIDPIKPTLLSVEELTELLNIDKSPKLSEKNVQDSEGNKVQPKGITVTPANTRKIAMKQRKKPKNKLNVNKIFFRPVKKEINPKK